MSDFGVNCANLRSSNHLFQMRNFQMCGFGVIYEIYDAYATIARFKCKVAHHAATYPTHPKVTHNRTAYFTFETSAWSSVSLRRVV